MLSASFPNFFCFHLSFLLDMFGLWWTNHKHYHMDISILTCCKVKMLLPTPCPASEIWLMQMRLHFVGCLVPYFNIIFLCLHCWKAYINCWNSIQMFCKKIFLQFGSSICLFYLLACKVFEWLNFMNHLWTKSNVFNIQKHCLSYRIFSYLDVVSLCRCAQVSKAWNVLALDGSNWQRMDLFDFQTDVEVCRQTTLDFVMHICNFSSLETLAILWFGNFDNGTLCKMRKWHTLSETELSDYHNVNCFINLPSYRKLCKYVANSWHQRSTSTELQRLLQYGMYETKLRWCKVVLTHTKMHDTSKSPLSL